MNLLEVPYDFDLNLYVLKYLELFNMHLNIDVMQMEAVSQNKLISKYEEIIEGLIYSLNLNDMEVYDNQSQKLLSHLIFNLNELIERKISQFCNNDLLIKFYYISSYISSYHGKMTAIINGNNKDIYINFNSGSYVELLTKSIENGLWNSIDKSDLSIISMLDSIKGIEKSILQYLYAMCFNKSIIRDGYRKLSPKDFEELYFLCYSILILIQNKDLYKGSLQNSKKIAIKNGKLILDESFSLKMQKIVCDIVSEHYFNNDISYEMDVLSVLNKNFYKHFGFSLNSIEKLMDIDRVFEKKLFAYIIAEPLFIETFSKELDCAINEFERMIKYLILKENDEYLSSWETYKSRLFENPIVKINLNGTDFYLISPLLLMHSLEILKKKMIFDLIPECKENSIIIQKKLKEKHEKDVFEIIEKYTKYSLINVKYFKHQKNIIKLDELDVVAIINQTLYLIECKNLKLTYTPYGYNSDFSKIKKFIYKLNHKKKIIEKNIDIVKGQFSIEVNEIKPVIVLKSYSSSIASSLKDHGIDIIPINLLEDYIKKNSTLLV
ncbi:hypothetical protein ABFT51_06335 [Paenibacillus peoriae]|uniref:hypothetical protein n=1 Tax=Paenibacillus peoriae TaxID=59893 RepID=UPI0032AF2274